MKPIYRILAFIGKEIHSILVQPQLLLLLVAGPFAVLLAFGLGYRPSGPELRTIVVQPPSAEQEQAVGRYLEGVGRPLHVVERTSDLSAALARLQARQVELVVVIPPDVRETLLEGRNVQLVFYHNAIDPTRIGYITAVVDGATSQINRAIVRQVVGEQQASAADYERVLVDLQDALGQIRSALQENDRPRAREISQAVRLNSGLVAGLSLLGSDPLSTEPPPATDLAQQARELDALLAEPESDAAALDQSLARMQEDTDRMLEALRRTRRIPPDVFVAPLVWDVQGVSTYQPGYVAYHSPTVLALLIQHLGITLAALSLVDERSAGAIELFRAAPVRAPEVLIGKFAAYLLLIAVTSAGLVGLLTVALHVPLLGDWRWLIAVLAALIAHSLSLGFLISALANSRSQAIQMSMLVLLGSIFFSGFFVPLQDFALPVRVLSFSLPVTYGIETLQQVVLRGEPPYLPYVGITAIWAIGLWIVSVRLLRRLFVGG